MEPKGDRDIKAAQRGCRKTIFSIGLYSHW